jgi:hypothetical protein
MKKILLFTKYFFVCFFSFSQKNNNVVNSQLNAFDIISKVLENVDISEDWKGQFRKVEGGHRTGIYNGNSELNFILFNYPDLITHGIIKLRINSSIYDGAFSKEQETVFSELTNFKFINSGGSYGTKIITADWDGYDAKFTMELTDDKDKDDVYFSIKGKSNWEDYARININETLFQELVNILSVTKIPQNVSKQKEIKFAKEKIRVENEKKKIEKEEQEKIRQEEQEKINKANSPIDNKDYLKIIGKRVRIGNLEVAEYDFPEDLQWHEAKKICTELGKGWRLPNKSELNILYKNRKKIGHFISDGQKHWSSSVSVNYEDGWYQYFDGGRQDYHFDNNTHGHVRAVIFFSNKNKYPEIEGSGKGEGSAVRLAKDNNQEILEKKRIFEEEKKNKELTELQIKAVKKKQEEEQEKERIDQVGKEKKRLIEIEQEKERKKLEDEQEKLRILEAEKKEQVRKLEAQLHDLKIKREREILDSLEIEKFINSFTLDPISYTNKLLVSSRDWRVNAKFVLPYKDKFLEKKWRIPTVNEMKEIINPSLFRKYYSRIGFFNNWGSQTANFLCVDKNNNLVILNTKRSGGSALPENFDFTVDKYYMDVQVIVRLVKDK